MAVWKQRISECENFWYFAIIKPSTTLLKYYRITIEQYMLKSMTKRASTWFSDQMKKISIRPNDHEKGYDVHLKAFDQVPIDSEKSRFLTFRHSDFSQIINLVRNWYRRPFHRWNLQLFICLKIGNSSTSISPLWKNFNSPNLWKNSQKAGRRQFRLW